MRGHKDDCETKIMKHNKFKSVERRAPEVPKRWGSDGIPAGSEVQPQQNPPANDGPGESRPRSGASWVDDLFATSLDSEEQDGPPVGGLPAEGGDAESVPIVPILITPRVLPRLRRIS